MTQSNSRTVRIESVPPYPAVDLSGEAGWIPFNAQSVMSESLRFVSCDPDGNRFRVRYYRTGEQQVRARIWFGPETSGPPGHVHGGAMAAVLDEIFGLNSWLAGYPVVVGNLNVNFRNLLPLEMVTTVESRIMSVEGRKILLHGRICNGETVYAEGECLCITIPAR